MKEFCVLSISTPRYKRYIVESVSAVDAEHVLKESVGKSDVIDVNRYDRYDRYSHIHTYFIWSDSAFC